MTDNFYAGKLSGTPPGVILLPTLVPAGITTGFAQRDSDLRRVQLLIPPHRSGRQIVDFGSYLLRDT